METNACSLDAADGTTSAFGRTHTDSSDWLSSTDRLAPDSLRRPVTGACSTAVLLDAYAAKVLLRAARLRRRRLTAFDCCYRHVGMAPRRAGFMPATPMSSDTRFLAGAFTLSRYEAEVLDFYRALPRRGRSFMPHAAPAKIMPMRDRDDMVMLALHHCFDFTIARPPILAARRVRRAYLSIYGRRHSVDFYALYSLLMILRQWSAPHAPHE